MGDTIELWELCEHGQIEAHEYDTFLGEILLIRDCPGGKKLMVRVLPNVTGTVDGRVVTSGTRFFMEMSEKEPDASDEED